MDCYLPSKDSKEGKFRSHLHRDGKAEIIKLTREEKEIAIASTKAMRLSVAGVDMLKSKWGPLVMEVNSSPGLKGIEKPATQLIGTILNRVFRKAIIKIINKELK